MSSEQLEKSSVSTGVLINIPLGSPNRRHLSDKNHFTIKPVSYLSNLTPMRGIAALLTVIFHIDIFLGWEMIPPSGSPLMAHLYLMVDFFFILSGFIMCHVYGNRFLKDVRRSEFKKFTIARFSRVYPLHLVTLVTTIVILYLFAEMGVSKNIYLQAENNLYSVFTNLFLVQAMNFNNWFTWVHASWSISTEWWAYMIFPFLVAPLFRLNARGRIFICLLCVTGYVCTSWFLAPLVTFPAEFHLSPAKATDWSLNLAYQYGFARCLCGFVLGMMTYHAFRDRWSKKIFGNGWTMIGFSMAAFISMHLNLPDIITVAFFPFIILSGAYGSDGINKVFATKPLQRLGDWSFSIYLIHQPFLILVTYGWSGLSAVQPNNLNQWVSHGHGLATSWAMCFVLIIPILFISYLSYRYIENPSRRWLNAKAA
ncbi:MAG TPA: acyltransferase [Puia sp.]|jgi:peptidoglycan/LPS O-acetylase OafA/YrhL